MMLVIRHLAAETCTVGEGVISRLNVNVAAKAGLLLYLLLGYSFFFFPLSFCFKRNRDQN